MKFSIRGLYKYYWTNPILVRTGQLRAYALWFTWNLNITLSDFSKSSHRVKD